MCLRWQPLGSRFERRGLPFNSRHVPIEGAVKLAPRKLGGRPTGFRRAPLVSRQPAYKPGSGGPANGVRRRDGHSSGTPVTRRLKQPTRTAGSGHRSRSSLARVSHRPYSVLLPVGFAVPPALPPARCALTAPFHPCRGKRNAPRRSVLCGTFPGLAPAGCYPAPLVHGARTFLPGNLSVPPERPSGRLTGRGMGAPGVAVKGRPAAWRCGRAPPWFWPGRDRRAIPARCCGSTDQIRRRCVPGGNGAGRPSPRRASPSRTRR